MSFLNHVEKKMSKKDLLCDPNLMSFMTELINRSPDLRQHGQDMAIMSQMMPPGVGMDLRSAEMDAGASKDASTMTGQRQIV